MTGELIHSLDRAAGTRLFRGTEVPSNAATAAAAQRPVVVGPGGIVGTADQVGHRRVAQHSSAVGQRRQLKRSTSPSARLILIGVESPDRIISVRAAMKAFNSSS